MSGDGGCLPGKHTSVIHNVTPTHTHPAVSKRAYTLLEWTETILSGRWRQVGMDKAWASESWWPGEQGLVP